MTKWADYGISAVRYNAAHTNIDRVRIHQDNGDSFGPAAEHERATIVKVIKDRVTFITIPQANGQWQKGQPVYIIKVNGVEYIKTVDNGRGSGQPRKPAGILKELRLKVNYGQEEVCLL